MKFEHVRNFFFAATPLLWGFAGLKSILNSIVPEAFTYAGYGGAVTLLLALVVDLCRRFFERASITRMFEARHAKRGDLAEARELSSQFLPEVPDLEQLQKIFEASRKCVWFVESTARSKGGKKSSRLGFFSIIRLTEEAVELLLKNRLDGFRMDRTHIAGPRRRAPAIYVGGMGAKTFRARGWLVQHIRARIDEFFEDGGKVVFSRPVTNDGLRIATQLGFVPVMSNQSGLGNVYKLESNL